MGWESVSPLAIPEILNLFNSAQGAIPGANQMQGVTDFAQQGMASPLLQTILQPALSNLMQGESDSRTAMADQFRGAGALRSSQYGKAIPKLEGQFQQARGNLISSTTANTLGPLLSALLQQQQQQFLPADSMTKLLGAVRPDVGFNNNGITNNGAPAVSPTQGPTSMANNPFFSSEGSSAANGSTGSGGYGGTSVLGGQYRYPGAPGATGAPGAPGTNPSALDPWTQEWQAQQAARVQGYQMPSYAGTSGPLGVAPPQAGGPGEQGNWGGGGGGPGDMMFGMTPAEWATPSMSYSPELMAQNNIYDPFYSEYSGSEW